MKNYNGAVADTIVIPAGTEFWRVYTTASAYPPHSFNSTNIAPWVDARALDRRKEKMPTQGRFEPVHETDICADGASLGGYLYVGLTLGAAIGEGVLRNRDLPPTGLVPRTLLAGLSLAVLAANADIEVVRLDNQASLLKINQDASLTCCDAADYGQTRIICTQILLATPSAHGVQYQCRSGTDERAAMFIDRGVAMPIRTCRTGRLDEPGWAQDLIEDGLYESYRQVLG